jgi:hypothetical protein
MPKKVEHYASKFYLFLVLRDDTVSCLRLLNLIDGEMLR